MYMRSLYTTIQKTGFSVESYADDHQVYVSPLFHQASQKPKHHQCRTALMSSGSGCANTACNEIPGMTQLMVTVFTFVTIIEQCYLAEFPKIGVPLY